MWPKWRVPLNPNERQPRNRFRIQNLSIAPDRREITIAAARFQRFATSLQLARPAHRLMGIPRVGGSLLGRAAIFMPIRRVVIWRVCKNLCEARERKMARVEPLSDKFGALFLLAPSSSSSSRVASATRAIRGAYEDQSICMEIRSLSLSRYLS